MSSSRLDIALVLGVLASIPAVPAGAFQGGEHEALSNAALAVALESLDGSGDLELEARLRSRFLDCEPEPRSRKQACESDSARCVPFGLITRAVDRVVKPEGLIPSRRLHENGFRIAAPKRCDEPSAVSSERVRRALAEHGDAAAGQAVADRVVRDREGALFRFAACRVEKKAGQFWTWLVAAHQNASHFEACAEAKYNALHELAITLARDAAAGVEEPFVALAAEAVALHFLQDLFAPGHLLTPRTGATDILARGLHNGYNRSGAPVFVDDDALSDLAMALETMLRADSSVIMDDSIGNLGLREEGSRAPRPTCGLRSPDDLEDPPCFFGDGSLKGSRQARDLVLLSAASIREVLLALDVAAETEETSRLRIEFKHWSAEPGSNSDLPDGDTLRRPCLVLARSGTEIPDDCQWSPDDQVPRNSGEVLGGYKSLRAEPLDRFSWSWRNLEFSVAYLFGDSDQTSGWRAEVGIPFGSPNDADIRCVDPDPESSSEGEPARRCVDPESASEDETAAVYFDRGLSRFYLGLPISGNLQAEEWPEYHALGLTLRPWYIAKRHRGWDYMWSLEGGWKWYYSPLRDTDRGVWGSHFALGYGVIFVDVGWERGSLLDAHGNHKRNSNYSLGLRVQIP